VELIWPEHGETKAEYIKRVADDPGFLKAFKERKATIEAAEQLWFQTGLALSSNGVGVKDLTLRQGETTDWLALSGVTKVEDVPRQRFEKEIIREGEFYKASEKLDFTVTGAHLDNWERQFSAMKQRGIKVRIPAGHGGADDPDKTRGEVLDMFRKGDRLVMQCEMIGEDGIQAAARNDVSIFAPVEWTDDQGNEYVQPITHVALCPDPVISDLGTFVPIAASRKGFKMDWSKWGAKLGLGADTELNDDNALSTVSKLISGLRKERDTFKAKAETVKASSGADDDKPKDSDKPAPAPIPKMVLSQIASGRKARLDSLVLSGNITPAVRDKFAERYCGSEGLKLSMETDTDDGFDSLVEALASNDPVKLGEQTKAQNATALSHGRTGNTDGPRANAERRAEKAKLTS